MPSVTALWRRSVVKLALAGFAVVAPSAAAGLTEESPPVPSPASVRPLPSADSAAQAVLAALPTAPTQSPRPWVTHAVEKAMQAQWCPDANRDSPPPSERAAGTALLHKPCLGLLPQNLGRVLLAIPESAIHISQQTRSQLLREPQPYLAVKGRSDRPDFITTVDFLEGITLRSFEGTTPADTVYLVEGPFRCIDDAPLVPREGEYVLAAGSCRSALADTRLYKWSSGDALADVTAEYLPAPRLSAAEQAALAPDSLRMDLTQLSQAPVLRWSALLKSRYPGATPGDYTPIDMPGGIFPSRQIGGTLAFDALEWDGVKFANQAPTNPTE